MTRAGQIYDRIRGLDYARHDAGRGRVGGRTGNDPYPGRLKVVPSSQCHIFSRLRSWVGNAFSPEMMVGGCSCRYCRRLGLIEHPRMNGGHCD